VEASAQRDVTTALARFIVESQWSSIPASVRHEAKRALLNWTGCALGGSHDETVDIALAALDEFSGKREASVLGRGKRADIVTAAAINALSSNILDFDDTHLRTVIHPSVPVAAAALALSERVPTRGADLLHAFILGVEAECRIGNAVSPEHYAAGWHITATCGVFGATAACAKLLGLGELRTAWAFGIAANTAAGTLNALGSMTKSWNMANAARNGLVAALLAAKGFTSTARALEGERGFAAIFSPRADLDEIVRGLGETWELAQNTYKPYPCGIVAHPVIDACLALREEAQVAADAIESVELRVHPLVRTLMGNAAPRSGLEAKLSVHHCAAAALTLGAVGVGEFTDERVDDPVLAALRARVTLIDDAAMPKDAAAVTVRTRSGSSQARYVPHASGSLERPMSDDALAAKLRGLAQWGCPGCDAGALLELAWSLDTLEDAGAFARAATPR
jgi:2-methylcitrate dehydratase PrpD